MCRKCMIKYSYTHHLNKNLFYYIIDVKISLQTDSRCSDQLAKQQYNKQTKPLSEHE